MRCCEYSKRLYKRFIERNANLRRSALSALRLLRVMYFCVHSPRTSAGSASCLYLRVLTVTFFGLFGRNAYILRTPLSPLRFCSTTMPPLFDKGEVSRSDGGDKKVQNETGRVLTTVFPNKSEPEHTIPQSCFACQLPLHKRAMVWRVRCRALFHVSPFGKGRC